MVDDTAGDTGVRWLDTEEMSAWLALAPVVMRLPAALDDQLRRDAGMSHFEYAVLARLSEAPDRTMRMSTLADFANGSLSRLSHVVKRLESRGWVYRRPCAQDGRYTNAVLTDLGYAQVAAAAPAHVAKVRELVIDPLTRAQIGQVRAISRRILSALEAAHS